MEMTVELVRFFFIFQEKVLSTPTWTPNYYIFQQAATKSPQFLYENNVMGPFKLHLVKVLAFGR